MTVFGSSPVSSLDTRLAAVESLVAALSASVLANATASAAAFDAERALRQQGDAAFPGIIFAERVGRVAGDQANADRLATELEARLAGDALGAAAVSTERALRIAGDQAIADGLALETAARVTAQALLERLGRLVPGMAGVDNSIAINAALNDPLISGVILPAGDIRLDHAIVVPSGKFVRGAGIDVTRLIRTNNIVGAAFQDKAIVRFATGAVGSWTSDFTAIAPKTNQKVQAAWMISARFCRAERIKAFNMGYAFFAQEGSQFCTFRDLQSFNANVHFETTAASDILFENTYAGDGDGDNPLGFEAVWHTLFGSKRVTFRNGAHVGKGSPFLVVADSGSGDAGFIDDIRFENLRSINTDGKNALQISKINAGASVGRVRFRNCELTAPGVAANIEQGQVTFDGGRIDTTSQEVFLMGPGTSLASNDLYVRVDAPAGASGNVYNATNAPITVRGGTVEATTPIIEIGVGSNLEVSPGTRFITPRRIYAPERGRTVRYVYPVDVALPAGTETIGTGTDQPMALFDASAGARYRVRLIGKLKKTGSEGNMALYFANGTGPLATTAGYISMEKPDRSFMAALDGPGYGIPYALMENVPADAIRGVMIDLEFTGQGNGVNIYYGSDGVTMLAGADFSIERLA